MKNGKCPAGEYYCYTNKECKPIPQGFMVDPAGMLRKENGASTTKEEWSAKYKKSIDCDNPKGFSQRAHCQGRKKKMSEESKEPIKYSKFSHKTPHLKKTQHQLDPNLDLKQLVHHSTVQYVDRDADGDVDVYDKPGKKIRDELPPTDTILTKRMMAKQRGEIEHSKKKIAYEGNLHQWFKGSRSKDGKGGWVNVVTGGTCASDEPGEGTPKCVSSAKRSSMTPEERRSAARRKKAADPGQQAKSGAAKPTYVPTDKPKKKMNEAKQRDHEYSMARSELSTVINAANRLKKKMGKGEGNIEAWVQSKITKAADYLDSAADYVDSGEMSEAKDAKGKSSGKKDACYHKVKSRYDVWPSAYASGALVKCRKVGADNWGNKSESLSPLSQRILKELNLDEKCWPGYEKKGMKTMFGKRYPNCVKKKATSEGLSFEIGGRKTTGLSSMTPGDVRRKMESDPGSAQKLQQKYKEVRQKIDLPLADEYVPEDFTRINQNGQTYSVVLMWRGKTYTFQMFVASMKRPSKQDIEKEVQKVYPDAKVMMFMPKMHDPAAPTIMIPEENQLNELALAPLVAGGLALGSAALAGTAIFRAQQAAKSGVDAAKKGQTIKPGTGIGNAAYGLQKRSDANREAMKLLNQETELDGEIVEDWQKVNRQDKTDGLSPAAVKAYRRENPGSKLQTAVTEKNPEGKRAKRRASFCRRMKGMKSKLTSAKTARDPDSRINKALRRWNCN
jgi:hypothetical protein